MSNFPTGAPLLPVMKRVALALLALCCVPSVAPAAPGDVDRRFGRGGVLTAGRLEGASTVAADGGGFLVAGGTLVPGVARITAGGRFDRRFGTDGIALNRRAGRFAPFAVRRNLGGEVLVSAFAFGVGGPPATFLRWSRRGAPAGTQPALEHFAGPLGGGVPRPGGGAYLWSRGYYGEPPATDVRALTADGATDRSFGGGSISLCAGRADCALETVAPAGRGLVASTISPSQRSRIVLIAADGRVVRRTLVGYRVTTLEALRDGSILAAARRERRGRTARSEVRLTRIRRDGTIDRSFGRRGTAVTGRYVTSYETAVTDIEVDGRGRIYLLVNSRGRPVVLRFTSRGRIDRRFRRGRIPRPRRFRDVRVDEGLDLLLDRPGRLLVVGKRYRGGGADPAFGCGIRDDFCASEVLLGAWRLKR